MWSPVSSASAHVSGSCMAKRAHAFRSDRLSCDLKGQALNVTIMLELDLLASVAVWLLAGFMHIPGSIVARLLYTDIRSVSGCRTSIQIVTLCWSSLLLAFVEAAVVAGPPICHLDVFKRLVCAYATIQRISQYFHRMD
jgi:hypothetical protein